MNLEKPIKIILAISFFICLFDMPYGYYEFVRFIALMGFGFLALKSISKGNNNKTFIFLGLAFLFQPFFKITLGRTIWNLIDLLVGIGLLISFLKNKASVKLKK